MRQLSLLLLDVSLLAALSIEHLGHMVGLQGEMFHEWCCPLSMDPAEMRWWHSCKDCTAEREAAEARAQRPRGAVARWLDRQAHDLSNARVMNGLLIVQLLLMASVLFQLEDAVLQVKDQRWIHGALHFAAAASAFAATGIGDWGAALVIVGILHAANALWLKKRAAVRAATA